MESGGRMSDRQNESLGNAETDSARTVSLARGLSTKLLLLTALFVLIAEVLIFVPSIANFRLRLAGGTAWNRRRRVDRSRRGRRQHAFTADPGRSPALDRREGDCRARR